MILFPLLHSTSFLAVNLDLLRIFQLFLPVPPKKSSQTKARSSARPKKTKQKQPPTVETVTEETKVTHPVEIKREFPGLPKSRGAFCTVFRLASGHETTINRLTDANKYEKEKGHEIVETLAFDSLEEHKLYLTSVKSPSSTVLAASTSAQSNFSCLSPDERTLLARLQDHRNRNEPKPRVLCVFQHTTFSRAVVMVIDFQDKNGRQTWNVKPLDHVRLLKSMAKVCGGSFRGRFTRDIITSMEAVPKRDLEKGPNEVVKSSGSFDTYVILAHFVLPNLDPQIDSMSSEAEFIKTVGHTTTSELVRLMTSNLYLEFYKSLTKDMSENYRGIVFSPKKGLNFSENLKTMQHHVTNLGNTHWTNYIIESKLHLIQSIIARHDQPTPKYIEDEEILKIPDTPDAASGKYAIGFNPGKQADDANSDQDRENSTDYDTAPEGDPDNDEGEEPDEGEEVENKKPAAKPKKATPKRATKVMSSAKKKAAPKTTKAAVKKPPVKKAGSRATTKTTPKKRASTAKHRK